MDCEGAPSGGAAEERGDSLERSEGDGQGRGGRQGAGRTLDPAAARKQIQKPGRVKEKGGVVAGVGRGTPSTGVGRTPYSLRDLPVRYGTWAPRPVSRFSESPDAKGP